MASPEEEPTRSLREWLRGHRSALLLLCVLPVLAPLAVAVYLHVVVTDRFDGRRWSVPSRLYSDALVLTPGSRFPAPTLEARLRRLGYRPVDEEPKVPGQFRQQDGQIDLHLRDFESPLHTVVGRPVSIRWKGDAVTSIREGGDGPPLARVAIEPEVIGTVYDRQMEDRTLIRISEVSPVLLDAIVVVEDRDFFRHGGINPKGIFRAVFQNLRGRRQGGSTLTMQLVKNLYLSPERTLRRKAVEAVLALLVDARYSKEEILEAYLNEIYLGQRGAVSITGVQEACRWYFGTDAAQVRLPEAALLAGMIRYPGGYNPWRSPDAARRRRATVLALLVEQGKITKAQADAAGAEPLTSIEKPPRRVSAPFFADYVLEQVAERYGRERLGREGLRIFTTLDADAQVRAEEAVDSGLALLESRHSKLRTEAGGSPLEAALVALDPANGYVRAMVGGRDYGRSQFNRAIKGARQTGSLFKPFVYLAAIEKETDPLTPMSVVRDTPITLRWDDGKVEWTPRNYDGQFHGEVTARQALEQSLNIPAVRASLQAGLSEVVQTARRCGVSARLQGWPSLALGAFEIAPLEICSAYAVFANGGLRIEPTGLLAVVDAEGHLLERPARGFTRAATPEGVYLVDSMLKGVLNRGTGARVRGLGVSGPMAGKTGTTNNYHDAWFIGYSPRFLAGVWVGFDDGRHVGYPGNVAAVPIWADWVKGLPPSLTMVDFPRPQGIVERLVDPEGQGLATPACPLKDLEPFRAGTEPTQWCRLHGGPAAGAPSVGPEP